MALTPDPLVGPRATRQKSIKHLLFPLAGGVKAWKGGAACFDTAQSCVVPAGISATLISLGMFAETVDNIAGVDGAKEVNVDLQVEIWGEWIENAAGADAVTSAELWEDCYWADDHTVTKTATGASVAGRVLTVDAIKGVLVQFYKLL